MSTAELVCLVVGTVLLAIGVYMALLPKINRKTFEHRRSVGGIVLSRFSYFTLAGVAVAGAAAAAALFAGWSEIAGDIGGFSGLMIFLALFSFLFDCFATMARNEKQFRKKSTPPPKTRHFAKPNKPR